MNIRTVKYEQLTGEEIHAWSIIQRSEPTLVSPFFRPEFTQVVSQLRKHVEVAVLEDGGRPVGFFPFERKPWNRGLPVGTRMSDYHGIVAASNIEIDPIQLLRGCGLSSWSFDHLPASQSGYAKFIFRQADSPVVDLSHGYEAFEATLSSHFRSHFRRKQRKLEREVGPIRFEPDSRDSSIFAQLLEWKVQQYQRTKTLNILGIGWVRELLERILDYRGRDFSAMMPALYAGDKLLAIGYLLRSENVLHSWFCAYDRDFYGYSIGILQQMKMLQAAADFGITSLDFGKGEEEYKKSLATGAIQIAEGVIDPVRAKATARSAWWAVRSGIQSSPLHNLIKRPVQKIFQLRGWLQLR